MAKENKELLALTIAGKRKAMKQKSKRLLQQQRDHGCHPSCHSPKGKHQLNNKEKHTTYSFGEDCQNPCVEFEHVLFQIGFGGQRCVIKAMDMINVGVSSQWASDAARLFKFEETKHDAAQDSLIRDGSKFLPFSLAVVESVRCRR